MVLILNIETSTQVCSVALSRNTEILSVRESQDEKSHSTLLGVFIEDIFNTESVERSDIKAIAVSRGPGSYTGLRIGVSTAKGIAYGLKIPLIAVDTLQAMAWGIISIPEFRTQLPEDVNIWLCPMIDARRMEVYHAFYNLRCEPMREVAAEIIHPGSFREILSRQTVLFFGNGSGKCKHVLDHPNALFIEGFKPSASHLTEFSLRKFRKKEFEDVAYFEPFYLKDFIATIPRKNIFR
ncbi:MAG: tRNA (adenosine(37)-N6)-threonylcarbamoyltransferase complex dimerization subunit type 1 TsaB [Bacteroidales bacterium]|nr:MAG: tRNA (adenosine(37)-N6)-threonylcarbamoyltransferase complex dimerization subunit type 1 TsaB [Bacteroidales bacterium]